MTKFRFSFILLTLLALFCLTAGDFFLTPADAARYSQDEEEYEDEEYADEDEEYSDEDEEYADEDEDGGDDANGEEDGEKMENYGEDFDPDAPLPSPKRVRGPILEAKDGMRLVATYYPSNRGKAAVPVILLHDWDGNRKDLDVLALELQAIGCAVLVPDLRGHGESTKLMIDEENSEEYTIKKENSKKTPSITQDYLETLVSLDLPCLKKFLMRQNNSGDLNIDKLCVGGVGYSGLAAAFFANADWNPMVKRKKENPRMGDVKSFFVLGPKKFKKLTLASSVTFPYWASQASCLIASTDAKDKKLLTSTKKAFEKKCSANSKERCWFKLYEESDELSEVLQDPEAPIMTNTVKFVQMRGVEREILWRSR